MSGAASTEPGPTPLERAAAAGSLPAWVEMSGERRAHVERVVELLRAWAGSLELSNAQRTRWLAAGWLHDALRDADPDALRETLDDRLRRWPAPLLHGPAAAERLQGAVTPEVAEAVRWHTVGHPRLGQLGRAVYLADFLEPGRDFMTAWRGELRERMPHEMDSVLAEVLASRIRHLLDERKPILEETAAFWSAVVGRRA
jgi:HD superfamily phosphohydrolase YqeK